jgi:hypothetical protein
VRGIYALPAKLQLGDVISAMALSLGPVLCRHDLSGAACGANEPGGGAAL